MFFLSLSARGRERQIGTWYREPLEIRSAAQVERKIPAPLCIQSRNFLAKQSHSSCLARDSALLIDFYRSAWPEKLPANARE